MQTYKTRSRGIFVPMSIRIYTKTGDDGTTGLFGGSRVSKADLRIEAYGTVDELNAIVGVVRTCPLPPALEQQLGTISADLFTLGADLATPLDPPPVYAIPRITEEHVKQLEGWIDEYDAQLEPLKTFILPGGTPAAAHLHVARTICRRAERRTVSLAAQEDVGTAVLHYLNRLSDYLFTASRAANAHAGVSDVAWKPNR
jgi:cob(I)alamin adenosyltransferase